MLAIFATCGVSLVDEADWPVRTADDLEFLKTIEGFAKPDHLALLRDEVNNGCKRLRPDEVLGACAVADLPAKFDLTAVVAARFLAKLDVEVASGDRAACVSSALRCRPPTCAGRLCGSSAHSAPSTLLSAASSSASSSATVGSFPARAAGSISVSW